MCHQNQWKDSKDAAILRGPFDSRAKWSFKSTKLFRNKKYAMTFSEGVPCSGYAMSIDVGWFCLLDFLLKQKY
jgi:hypothetical protein